MTNKLPLLGHSCLSLGIMMERLVVFSKIGGLSPSIELVTVTWRRLESSISQRTVLIKLEDKATLASEEFWKNMLEGRSSLSSSSLVAFDFKLIKVRSKGSPRYFSPSSNVGTLVVLTMTTYY